MTRPPPEQLPLRLIDLAAPSLPQSHCLLVETTGPEFEYKPYVTLSHCWGDPSKLFKAKKETNLDRLLDPSKGGIDCAELPANFVDAINVARRLGVRYIWIDALCITQDDGEFATEGMKMHAIYRNASCTIAAADSADSLQGLFRTREMRELRVIKGEGELMLGKQAWLVLRKDMWERELLGRVLYTRGWVFQGEFVHPEPRALWSSSNGMGPERMMSSRIIHYSHDQIFWDCAGLSACEALPNGLPPPLDTLASIDRQWREQLQLKQIHSPESDTVQYVGTADVSIEQFWKMSVAYYTRCNFTNFSDRLDAVSAVARVARQELPLPYCQGFWQYRLHEQLAWRVVHSSSSGSGSMVKKDTKLGPTWTWVWTIAEIQLSGWSQYEGYEHSWAKNHEGKELCMDVAGSGDELTLKSWKLPIRERLARVIILRKEEDDYGQYSVCLADADADAHTSVDPVPGIEAFLDVPLGHASQLEASTSKYFLCVLAVKNTVDGTSDQKLDGIGLVLEEKGVEYTGEYIRVGTFSFAAMGREEYGKLTAGEMQNFWLV